MLKRYESAHRKQGLKRRSNQLIVDSGLSRLARGDVQVDLIVGLRQYKVVGPKETAIDRRRGLDLKGLPNYIPLEPEDIDILHNSTRVLLEAKIRKALQ